MDLDNRKLNRRLQALRNGRGTNDQLIKLAQMASEHCWNANLDCPLLESDGCAFEGGAKERQCFKIEASDWLQVLKRAVFEWQAKHKAKISKAKIFDILPRLKSGDSYR